MRILLSTIGLSLLVLQVSAQAPESIASDRPGNAFSPLTVGSRVFQAQIGADYGGNRFDGSKVSNYNFLTTFYRYGLTKSFEISAQIDYRYDRIRSSPNLSGVSNLGLGLRYNILRNSNGGPDIGALLTMNFSNVLEDYETQNEVPTFILVVQQSFLERFALNANLGATFVDPDREYLGLYVLNIGYGISDKWSAYIESYGSYNSDDFIRNYDAGFAFMPNKDVQIDFYGGAADYQNLFSYFFSVGLSMRTGRLD